MIDSRLELVRILIREATDLVKQVHSELDYGTAGFLLGNAEGYLSRAARSLTDALEPADGVV